MVQQELYDGTYEVIAVCIKDPHKYLKPSPIRAELRSVKELDMDEVYTAKEFLEISEEYELFIEERGRGGK